MPGVMETLSLYFLGRERRSLTVMESPIKVAIEQCGIVGVNVTVTVCLVLSILIKLSYNVDDVAFMCSEFPREKERQVEKHNRHTEPSQTDANTYLSYV